MNIKNINQNYLPTNDPSKNEKKFNLKKIKRINLCNIKNPLKILFAKLATFISNKKHINNIIKIENTIKTPKNRLLNNEENIRKTTSTTSEKKQPILVKITSYETSVANKTELRMANNIDDFISILENKNIYFKSNNVDKDNKNFTKYENLIINHNKIDPRNIVTINKRNLLGHGSYGTAYRIGNFVIKIPFYDVYKISPHSQVDRCARLLNQLNRDKNFSRAITLNNGKDILISKYISGDDIIGKEAYDFVKERGRVLFDYNSEGNVKKDNNGKMYIIDTDLAAQPIKLKRKLSVGSVEIRELHKEQLEKYPVKKTKNYPLYYSEIKDK